MFGCVLKYARFLASSRKRSFPYCTSLWRLDATSITSVSPGMRLTMPVGKYSLTATTVSNFLSQARYVIPNPPKPSIPPMTYLSLISVPISRQQLSACPLSTEKPQWGHMPYSVSYSRKQLGHRVIMQPHSPHVFVSQSKRSPHSGRNTNAASPKEIRS